MHGSSPLYTRATADECITSSLSVFIAAVKAKAVELEGDELNCCCEKDEESTAGGMLPLARMRGSGDR